MKHQVKELKSDHELTLAHLTLLHVSPPRLVEVASKAGFDSVNLRLLPAHQTDPSEPRHPMSTGDQIFRETKARLGDLGLAVHDIEVIRLQNGIEVSAYHDLFEVGFQLGARHVVVISDDSDENRTADNLAKLAQVAAQYRLKLALEFMVYTGTKTLRQALRVVEKTGMQEISVLVDVLHFMRSGGCIAELSRIDKFRIPFVQLCDAPRHPPDDGQGGVRMEARSHRLFPGSGELPLMDFLRALPEQTGIAVEVPVFGVGAEYNDQQIAEKAFQTSIETLRQSETRKRDAPSGDSSSLELGSLQGRASLQWGASSRS